ncbi:RING finger protein [Gregarina niphandrodes]|uniref:RING-type E3 ubiquitin transferase n=1 Tax=Gregarina niphandrodes TaxID=110365 RepID=A0A023AYA0_GRENI|nr:RING finger protein [Gregarina niphandrodes]EZG43642.1 RING finger protein [Gregarina niphandrodes]|eukprot:XP_011133116.1 RING finger protein [Gregarina niphandrodes]
MLGGFGESVCGSLVPTAAQVQGEYVGFALWPSNETVVDNSFGARGVSVWRARVEVLKATNKFWETYAARVALATEGDAYSFVARGVRAANARALFLRASHTPERRRPRSWWQRAGEAMLGADATDPAAVADPAAAAEAAAALEDVPGAPESRCHVTGSLARMNAWLEPPTGSGGEPSPPVEGASPFFNRAPDLAGRFVFSEECQPLPATSLSLALRKLDPEYLAEQKLVIGGIVALKAVAEIVLYSRQFTAIQAQPVLLKTSPWMIGLAVLYDAFEAQFFFGVQAQSDMLSVLAMVGVLKVLLVCVVQMRWLILLWKERAMQRQNARGQQGTEAWIADMNKGIRSSAALMVAVLLASSNLFDTYPEPVLLLFATYLLPQIAKNIWCGVRHPLKPWFLSGTALCRSVLPILLWSSRLNKLWKHDSPLPPGLANITSPNPGGGGANLGDAYPPWFMNTPIPAEFMDLFGAIQRRPNTPALAVLTAFLAAQVLLLLLQAWWSPRIFIPHWIADKYLPVVFDYELDVARAAAQRQESEPTCTGVDCVICFTRVKFADYACVVTPCQHFFHKECLLKWMEVKLECPTCRRILPPY